MDHSEEEHPKACRRRRVRRLILVTALILSGAVCAVPLLIRLGGAIGGLCPLRMLTGLSCPGCGTTRAANAVLHGHFLTALRLNYLLPLEFGWLLRAYILMARGYLRTGRPEYAPRSSVPDIVCLCLVLAWAVFRNLVGI